MAGGAVPGTLAYNGVGISTVVWTGHSSGNLLNADNVRLLAATVVVW